MRKIRGVLVSVTVLAALGGPFLAVLLTRNWVLAISSGGIPLLLSLLPLAIFEQPREISGAPERAAHRHSGLTVGRSGPARVHEKQQR